MAKRQKAYFGMGWLISLIFAIIPVTSWLFGFITRFSRGNLVGGILNLIPITIPLFWIVDLVTMIVKHDITFLA